MTQSQLMQTERLTLNVRVHGVGPPLLFLGGSNFDLSIKAPVFDTSLTTYFTVAAADPRGLGLSEMPPGHWTMKDFALDAVGLMDTLGWPSAVVLGESFGAMVAMELALLAPERIQKLGLAAGAPGGHGGASYPIHELLNITDQRARVTRSLTIQDSRFETLLNEDPSEAVTRITNRLHSDHLFTQHSHNAAGYPRLLATRAQHDCWSRLPNIQTDTVLIAGLYDNQAPLDRSEAMARQLPNAENLTFEEGHNVLFASSAPVDALIKRWHQ